MVRIPVVEAHADLAIVVGRMPFEFNTEFHTAGPSAEELARRFADLLARGDVLVLLANDEHERSGFAYLTLRPTPLLQRVASPAGGAVRQTGLPPVRLTPDLWGLRSLLEGSSPCRSPSHPSSAVTLSRSRVGVSPR